PQPKAFHSLFDRLKCRRSRQGDCFRLRRISGHILWANTMLGFDWGGFICSSVPPAYRLPGAQVWLAEQAASIGHACGGGNLAIPRIVEPRNRPQRVALVESRQRGLRWPDSPDVRGVALYPSCKVVE